MSEYFHRKYGWAKVPKKKRERVLSDPELLFKKWLRRRLDILFDGRGSKHLQKLEKSYDPPTRIGDTKDTQTKEQTNKTH